MAALCAATLAISAQSAPITLSVDLTDAPRKILHATEIIPVQPGPLTLVYPEWIPGEHMPSGPIINQAGFLISTPSGQPVKWERDLTDMYSYHVTVPEGVTQLNIKMDFLATGGANFTEGGSTSANLALLSWNTLLVYPLNTDIEHTKASDVMVTPSITIPDGWHFGTALEPTGGATEASGHASFQTVSLEQLIDSPVLAGRWFREIDLAPEVSPKHYLDLAGDGPEDIALNQTHIDQFSKLVRETGALYQSRHYGSYHFLVTLSDQVAHFGLEHHQSSDDRVPEKTFIDEGSFAEEGDLLPHEFTHSWNGKYRRPAGLATPNYQEPMKGNLLWVYEGLTDYLGGVLATRSGIWSADTFRDRLATIVAEFNDARPGRTWRDLQDTATAAQILYNAGGPSITGAATLTTTPKAISSGSKSTRPSARNRRARRPSTTSSPPSKASAATPHPASSPTPLRTSSPASTQSSPTTGPPSFAPASTPTISTPPSLPASTTSPATTSPSPTSPTTGQPSTKATASAPPTRSASPPAPRVPSATSS
jgi:hypothetical protein